MTGPTGIETAEEAKATKLSPLRWLGSLLSGLAAGLPLVRRLNGVGGPPVSRETSMQAGKDGVSWRLAQQTYSGARLSISAFPQPAGA